MVRHWQRLPREVVDTPFLEKCNAQGGWGPEQPDLIANVPAHGRGAGADGL